MVGMFGGLNTKKSKSYKPIKWHSTSLLLTLIRLTNTFDKDGKSAFFEFIGRVFGWGLYYLVSLK